MTARMNREHWKSEHAGRRNFPGMRVLALGSMFLLLGAGTVWGGNLNANEQELMEIARGTFTYEGKTYRAQESYINEAYYYLIRDDIDVTDEQKASAIKKVYASVKQGIDEGYLYLVEEEAPKGEKPTKNQGSTSTEGTAGAGQDASVSEGDHGAGQNKADADADKAGADKTDTDIADTGTGTADNAGEPEETDLIDESKESEKIQALENMSEFLASLESVSAKETDGNESGVGAAIISEDTGITSWKNWSAVVLNLMAAVLFGAVLAAGKTSLFHHHKDDKDKKHKNHAKMGA